MSLQETSFEYEHVLWVCEFLPYRIIVCVDAIQYIVQKREQNMYRNMALMRPARKVHMHGNIHT